jgi:hypothetical protein
MKSSPMLGTSNINVASILRKEFQVFLHIPDAQVSCTIVNFLINEIKGDSTFPQKTKSPSGATAGGILPKNGPNFFKKLYFKSAKYISEDHVWFEDPWIVASLCDE